MSRRRAFAAWAVGVLCAVVGATACGSSGHALAGSGVTTASSAPAQPTLVVFGDNASAPVDDSIPVGQTWPQVFFRDALSRNTVFVNLSTQPASAHVALDVELPQARQLHPTVAAILIGFVDVDEGDPPVDFGHALDALVTDLRGDGVHTVLMGTLPDAIHGVTSYNEQIAHVANNDSAVLVDLAALHLTFVHNPNDFTPVPDAASQRAIGDAFTAAYRAATSASP